MQKYQRSPIPLENSRKTAINGLLSLGEENYGNASGSYRRIPEPLP